ncbi:MAG: hypothetical protein VB858_05625 [Planctomycetaceae bacterium]
MSSLMSPPGSGEILPESPHISSSFRRRAAGFYDRFAEGGPPAHLEDFLREEFSLDVSTEYAGIPIRNPWGKASGQLSMNADQIREDVECGLGFVVLKTVIAQDQHGTQSMDAWAIHESRMLVERITGPLTGQSGWTVTWKGRGWWRSFDEYLALIRAARDTASQVAGNAGGHATLIVPSCKYHLPAPGETEWRKCEYDYSTQQFLDAWCATDSQPMPIEKDFSPTLAGSDLATGRNHILHWLREVPGLIRSGSQQRKTPAALRVGLKLFNAMFDDRFQLEMLQWIHAIDSQSRPDFYVYGNRLFNSKQNFSGASGVAYGGPDLSDRNLRVMSVFSQESDSHSGSAGGRLPWSATGGIGSGRMAVEYALRGASSFQLHTFFQLPASEYHMKTGRRTARAMHELYFHPETGFVVWAEHLRQVRSLSSDRILRIQDLPA